MDTQIKSRMRLNLGVNKNSTKAQGHQEIIALMKLMIILTEVTSLLLEKTSLKP